MSSDSSINELLVSTNKHYTYWLVIGNLSNKSRCSSETLLCHGFHLTSHEDKGISKSVGFCFKRYKQPDKAARTISQLRALGQTVCSYRCSESHCQESQPEVSPSSGLAIHEVFWPNLRSEQSIYSWHEFQLSYS